MSRPSSARVVTHVASQASTLVAAETAVSPRVSSSQTTVNSFPLSESSHNSDIPEDSPDSTGVSSSSCMPPPKPPGPLLAVTPERKDPTSSSSTSSSSSSTSTSPSPSPGKWEPMRPANQVRSVMLNGVPIVALVIDCKERLCLAQISNTLLKDFSYNEIHNRRVALGITCVQCTPVQLEILRRAGAMPVSSRRCGMITKREAERLCKSFLTENAPPKLPDNFAFDVRHECAWGCRGSFVPSRYNSSRAKCIKCTYCNLFFSPNKFIFHSHRLPDSKYVQPDAANFNSWRRHLKLYGEPPDEFTHAWEDVKAMFNGGSRKRVMAASVSRYHMLKRPRLPDQPGTPRTAAHAPPQIPQPAAASSASGTSTSSTIGTGKHGHPTGYLPMVSYQPPKPFQLPGSPTTTSSPYIGRSQNTASQPQITPHIHPQPIHQTPNLGQPPSTLIQQPAFTASLTSERSQPADRGLADYVWAAGVGMGKHPSTIPTAASAYGFFWARGPALGGSGPLPVTGEHHAECQSSSLTCSDFGLSLGFRLSSAEGIEPQVGSDNMAVEWPSRPRSESDSDIDECSLQGHPRMFPTPDNLVTPGKDSGRHSDRYFSAFKPVLRTEVTVRQQQAPPTRHAIETLLRPSPERKNIKERHQDEDSRVPTPASTETPMLVIEENNHPDQAKQCGMGTEDEDEDADVGDMEHVDVEMTDDDDRCNDLVVPGQSSDSQCTGGPPISETDLAPAITGSNTSEAAALLVSTDEPRDLRCKRRSLDSAGTDDTPHFEGPSLEFQATETNEQGADSFDWDSKRLAQMSKEELEEILMRELHARQRAEKQFEIMKGSFQEQVKREVSYREEISKQLELMRETLCSELDQERKARYAVLQKLKEAHDALHHFSCKVLIPRQCTDCAYQPILPQ